MAEAETQQTTQDESGFGTTGLWVLFATISASSMGFIAQGALNPALPTIQESLNASGADILWIVNVYQLLLGALILVGGSLGDHYGRKRVYMIGIVIFAVASFACGIAPTTTTLIICRAAQGVGGALMIPGSLAIISAYFDSSTRGRAIGTWSSFTTMTSVLGPTLGGALADVGLWRAVFFINLPLAAVALYALVVHVPESKDDTAPKQLDYLGALLVTLGLAGIVYGFTEIGRVGMDDGLGNPLLIGPLLFGFVFMVLFVIVEARSNHPLMSLKLFRSRTFAGANLLTLMLYGALGGALFFLPLNLIQIQGYSATAAGLATLPFSILLVLISPWAGGLVDRIGPRPPLIGGPILVGFAFILLAVPSMVDTGNLLVFFPVSYFFTYLPGLLLFGVGMGIVVAPLTTTVMGSVPQHNAGTASGINNAVSRSSGVLATAVLGGIALLSFTSGVLADVDDLGLRPQSTVALEAETEDLAAARVPYEITAQFSLIKVVEVRQALDASFIYTFRLIMLIGAGMSFISALMAYLLIEERLEPADKLIDGSAGEPGLA